MLETLRGERILITGGTGFVGIWLAELVTYLNDRDRLGVRLLLLSSRAYSFREKAPHLASRSDIELIEQDVRHLVGLPNDVGFVIHAAGNPDNRLHASDPLQVIRVISQGTASVLEAATRLPGLKKFLNISSGLIYGRQPLDLDGIPESFTGGIDCASVNSAYIEAKRFGEMLCATYRNQYRMPIVTARPFAFLGPYQCLDRPWAINNFIRDSLQGGPIRIQGDGETVRSYMYASDMAWWLLRILGQGATGKNYNVGSPRGITLAELAEKISGNFPIRPKVLVGTGMDRNLHNSKFVPDVSMAKIDLGLGLSVDLDLAIQRTIKWNQISGLL
ncbi:MAG: NAD-dependent epimerase/dehydratase family protein [Anaerolineaceae bacterium]|nr:NAD-dependent epimerase/dehydratase family protein [Anaerolineaceae bacterium]